MSSWGLVARAELTSVGKRKDPRILVLSPKWARKTGSMLPKAPSLRFSVNVSIALAIEFF